jgi:hypothetical protein
VKNSDDGDVDDTGEIYHCITDHTSRTTLAAVKSHTEKFARQEWILSSKLLMLQQLELCYAGQGLLENSRCRNCYRLYHDQTPCDDHHGSENKTYHKGTVSSDIP